MPLAANTAGGSAGFSWIFLLLLIAAGYFMIVRPTQRRRREVQTVQRSLGVGDEVLTTAGLYGTVVALDDQSVTIEVSPGVTNRYVRQAVSQVVTKAGEATTAEEATEPTRTATPVDPITETKASDVVDPD